MSTAKRCRICLEESEIEGNPFISPCSCIGTAALVHRDCIEQWRFVNRGTPNFYRCRECQTPYVLPAQEREFPLVDPAFVAAVHLHLVTAFFSILFVSALAYMVDYMDKDQRFPILKVMTFGYPLSEEIKNLLRDSVIFGIMSYYCMVASLLRICACMILWGHSLFGVHRRREYYAIFGLPMVLATVTSPDVYYLWPLVLAVGDVRLWLPGSAASLTAAVFGTTPLLRLHVETIENINARHLSPVIVPPI